MKKIMKKELTDPSDEFVKFFAKKVYSGPVTERVRLKFKVITKNALNEITKDQVSMKLKSALEVSEPTKNGEVPEVIFNPPKGVFTTAEELDAFHTIKTILRENVSLERVFIRDTLSYCGVLLDNSNRKPIARLYFNRKQKYMSVFNNNREEERIPIDNVNDIYKYSDRLKSVIDYYNRVSDLV